MFCVFQSVVSDFHRNFAVRLGYITVFEKCTGKPDEKSGLAPKCHRGVRYFSGKQIWTCKCKCVHTLLACYTVRASSPPSSIFSLSQSQSKRIGQKVDFKDHALF